VKGKRTTLVNLYLASMTPSPVRHELTSIFRNVTLGSLRRQIGIVPQETNSFFPVPIAQNIAFGQAEFNLKAVQAAATELPTPTSSLLQLADGYHTWVGERGVNIRRTAARLAIARAISRPRILILDETTSALVPESEALVQEAWNG